jgi:hypothetical protein
MIPAKALAALALIGLTGCTMADSRPARLTDSQSKELAKALEGKTAGTPVNCVRRQLGTAGLHAVSDELLIYRVNRNLVYRNNLNGSCVGISRGNAMVLKPTNDQYCRNDIVGSVDFTTGMRGPSCALGDFVPYRSAGK